MRLGGKSFPSVAACGLTAAALFAGGVTARAQTVSPGAGGPGMSGASPGLGGNLATGPAGPAITGNPSSLGGNGFAGGNPGGGGFGSNVGATIGAPGGMGNLSGAAPSGGGGATSGTGGSGGIVALTFYAAAVNAPSSGRPLPARLSPELRDLISRSEGISAETGRDLAVAYDAGGTLVLRGTVASRAEGHAVESLIRFAPGVTGVRNEMTLRGP